MIFDDKFLQFLIEIIKLYNPKRKGLFSKPMMELRDKKKFYATVRTSHKSKQYQVGTEPEDLAGALSSVKIMMDELDNDSGDLVITLYDTKDRVIIVFGQINGDREFAVAVGKSYSSKKEGSTYKFY